MLKRVRRAFRYLTAPENRKPNTVFGEMVGPLAGLLAVPLYELPASMLDKIGRFYASVGSGPFIVARALAEASLRLDVAWEGREPPDKVAAIHAMRVLLRIFGERAATTLWNEWLEARKCGDSDSKAAHAMDDARLLVATLTVSDAEPLSQLSDLDAVREVIAEMGAIDPSIAAQPEDVQLFRAAHWLHSGSLLVKAFESWLSGDGIADAFEHLGLPIDRVVREAFKQ